jgi:hypothetical protein
MAHKFPFGLRRSLERISRELSVLSVEFERLCSNNATFDNSADSNAVKSYIQQAEVFRKQSDIEGAWACIHAAQCALIPGLKDAELSALSLSLDKESVKLPEWRKTAVHDLLKRADVDSVREAMRLKNEFSANTYHKIWLTLDQLKFLVCACAFGLLLLSPVGKFSFCQGRPSMRIGTDELMAPPVWGFTMLAAVIGIGICGGSFSVATSMFANMKTITIPERVANIWSTSIRAILGGVSGLAGYAFAQAGLFKIANMDPGSIASSISIAFIFGYAGESLITRIVASSEKSSKG